MPSVSPLLSLFYQALASPFGISLSVSDTAQAKAKLYAARASGADPDLSQISIHQSPYLSDEEIWLVKRPRKALNGPVSSETDSPKPGRTNDSSGGDAEA